MKQILIVEDSSTVTKILKHLVAQHRNINALFADSLESGRLLFQQHKESIFAAIVDLHLPDAPAGETVDFFLAENIPVIVLTADFQEQKREALLNKGIVDYVVKESRFSYNYALRLVDRLARNQHIKILVAEDSKPARRYVCNLLKKHLFQVLEAENGLEALDVLNQHPDIKLLITDYHMPEMDGFSLTRSLRQNVDKSDLVIIGLSADGEGSLSARFIKNGANDFLKKPFNHEEFFCRIIHNIEEMELIEQIRETANRDYLTGVYNDHFFFNKCAELYQQAEKNNSSLALATVGIDRFASIRNDFGFDVAGEALRFVAQELEHAFQRFYLARLDGEIFALALPGLSNEQASTLLNRFREVVASMTIDLQQYEEDSLEVSISAGISNQLQKLPEQQIRQATELLHAAQEAGGNMVMSE